MRSGDTVTVTWMGREEQCTLTEAMLGFWVVTFADGWRCLYRESEMRKG